MSVRSIVKYFPALALAHHVRHTNTAYVHYDSFFDINVDCPSSFHQRPTTEYKNTLESLGISLTAFAFRFVKQMIIKWSVEWGQ